jgi:hypothetical protein
MFLVQHKKYNATIYAIEPAVEVATRTLQVRAIADNQTEGYYQERSRM